VYETPFEGLAYRSYNMPGRDPRWLDRYPRFELSFVPSFEVTALDEASWQELCAGMASAGRSMKEARPAFRQAEADSLAARIGADRYAAWTAAQGTYRAWFDPLLILDPDSRFNRRARRTNDPIFFDGFPRLWAGIAIGLMGADPEGDAWVKTPDPIIARTQDILLSWKSKLPRDLQMAVSDADRESYLETIKERWRAHQLAVEEIRAEADARRPPDQVARPLPSSGMEHKKTIRLLEAAMAAAHDDLMLSLGGEPPRRTAAPALEDRLAPFLWGKTPHQMFGLGTAIQSAPLDHSDKILLLQLASTPSLFWMFGDAGVYQVWITPDDLRAGRWDRAFATLEGG